MALKNKQGPVRELERTSGRRAYLKPTLQNFGPVSEVTAGGRGSEPEVGGDNNQGIKKKES